MRTNPNPHQAVQIHLAASLHEQNAATAGQDCCFFVEAPRSVREVLLLLGFFSTATCIHVEPCMQESFDWAAVPTDG